MVDALQNLDASAESYFAVGRILTTNEDESAEYEHQVNIDDAASEVRIGPRLSVNGPQPINDTINAGRRRLGTRHSAGRDSELLRVDIFFIAPENLLR